MGMTAMTALILSVIMMMMMMMMVVVVVMIIKINCYDNKINKLHCHVNVHRDKFLIIRLTRCTNFPNLCLD